MNQSGRNPPISLSIRIKIHLLKMVAGWNPFFSFFFFFPIQRHWFHILHFPNSTGLFTKPTGHHYTKYRFSPDIGVGPWNVRGGVHTRRKRGGGGLGRSGVRGDGEDCRPARECGAPPAPRPSTFLSTGHVLCCQAPGSCPSTNSLPHTPISLHFYILQFCFWRSLFSCTHYIPI